MLASGNSGSASTALAGPGTVYQLGVIGGANIPCPEVLKQHVTAAQWDNIMARIRKGNDEASFFACGIECCICIVTGVVCIFCCHPCIESCFAGRTQTRAPPAQMVMVPMMPNQQVGYPISVIPQQGQQLGYSPAYNPQPIQQPQSAYSPSYSEVDKSSYSAEYTPGQTTSPTAYPSPPPAYPLQPTNQYAPIPMASPVESSIVGEYIVPPNVAPGSEVQIMTPNQVVVSITIPKTAKPGDVISYSY